MTDQQLLELAAKADGWSCWQSKHGYLNLTDPYGNKHVCCQDWVPFDSYSGEKTNAPTLTDAVAEVGWNPLIDDTDAFRLAVKLGFFIYQIKVNDQKITVVEWDFDHVGKTMIFDEMHKLDPYAATRRAIVRAAAEIGKNIEVTK
jgi:hypothetical protein